MGHTHKKRKFHRTQKNKAPEGNPLDIQTTSEERENERIAQLQLAFLRLLLDSSDFFEFEFYLK